MKGIVTGSGIEFEAAGIDRQELLVPKGKEHIWIATAVYRLGDKELSSDKTFHMDMENLVMTMFGCFVCEQPFQKRLVYRDCPGEPEDSVKR